MNQQDFRALLGSSSTPGRASQSATPRSRFGQAPPKRGSEETKKSSLEFKPRDNKGKSTKWKKKDQEGKGEGEDGDEDADETSAYRDRAKERRVGKPNDFADAEKLLEDFQARSEGVGDKSLLKEQMKYLGGDAEHSVLVKGLDFALLEREKAKLSQAAEEDIEDVEAALDKQLREEMSARAKKGKKSRDEILKELKASRGGVQGEGEAESERKESKFKPIGFKPIGAKEEKKKKKRKIAPSTSADATATTRPQSSTSTSALPPPPAPPKPVALPLPTPKAAPVLDSDGEIDIFGGVGEYDGLGDSDTSDSDDDSKTRASKPKPATESKPAAAPAPVAGKRKYFDDAEEEDFGVGGSTAPSSVTNLKRTLAANANGEKEEGEEGEEEEEQSMRLQPLAGSSMPSVRDLLDMDTAAEKEELRKAKKAKWQAKAGELKREKEKNMTEEDKANRDYQVMQNFLAKKEAKGKGKDDDEE